MAFCMEISNTFEPLFFEFNDKNVFVYFVWSAKRGGGRG